MIARLPEPLTGLNIRDIEPTSMRAFFQLESGSRISAIVLRIARADSPDAIFDTKEVEFVFGYLW